MVLVVCGMVGNYDISNWFHRLIHYLLVNLFFLLKLQRKEGWKGKWQEYFEIQFLFFMFTTILRCEFFPGPVEISVLPDQGVKGVSGIILANYESLVSNIDILRVHRGCLISRYVQLMCYLTRKLS